MKTTMAILGAVVLALGAGLVSVAQVHVGHGGHAGHGPHGPEGVMAVPHMVAWLVNTSTDELDTSESQRARLLAVKERVLSEAEVLQKGHEATHQEFKRQWDEDKMDSARLHALVDARLEEMRKMLHGAVDGVVEIHDTLTPAQRKTLTAKIEAMHDAK